MVAYYGVVSVLLQVGWSAGRRAAWRAAHGHRGAGHPGRRKMVAPFRRAAWMSSLAGVTMLVLGMTLLRPATTSSISQAAGAERQGDALMGATQSIQSIAGHCSPGRGALIAAGAPGAPFLAAALVALTGLPWPCALVPASVWPRPPTPTRRPRATNGLLDASSAIAYLAPRPPFPRRRGGAAGVRALAGGRRAARHWRRRAPGVVAGVATGGFDSGRFRRGQ